MRAIQAQSMSMSTSKSASRFVVVAVTLIAVLAGCTGNAGSKASKPTATTTTTIPVPPPEVVATIADGQSGVAIGNPVGLTVKQGTFQNVAITLADQAAGVNAPGAGLMNSEKTGWLSPSLAPHTSYQLVADIADAAGATSKKTWKFTTGAPVKELHTSINVGEGSSYGVGMPIVVTLNEPVPDDKRADVMKRLSVSSTPSVEGAWRWFSETELHYRTKQYWPAHTKVSLNIDFTNLNLGKGVWGVDGRKVNFAIGDARVAVVDARAHRMVVRENGNVVRDMLVSTGKDSTPTRSGIHVINEKADTVIMDSATVGIPKGSAGYYRLTTRWNVRISNSGEFVHSAPWSVGSQGYENVSHGCVNANPTDAEWFYNFSQIGDVVEVQNTAEQHQSWNGWGDWQIPWDQWVA